MDLWNNYNTWNFVINCLVAVGTIGAVIIALWQTIKQYRINIVSSCMWGNIYGHINNQNLNNSDTYIVGIDREAAALGKSLEDYVNYILSHIRNSKISEELSYQPTRINKIPRFGGIFYLSPAIRWLVWLISIPAVIKQTERMTLV